MDYSKLKLTKNKAIYLIKKEKISWRELSDDLKNDRDIVIALVEKNGVLIENVSMVFKDDYDIAYKALCSNPYSFQYISDNLKGNKVLVLMALDKYPNTLFNMSKSLRDDEDIILKSIKKNGYYLRYASERLKNKKDLVIEAVNQNPICLNFAAEHFHNDKDILESLEKTTYDKSKFSSIELSWYEEKMELLANIREKEMMENTINSNNNSTKKIKF